MEPDLSTGSVKLTPAKKPNLSGRSKTVVQGEGVRDKEVSAAVGRQRKEELSATKTEKKPSFGSSNTDVAAATTCRPVGSGGAQLRRRIHAKTLSQNRRRREREKKK
ncbi:hypothetical protein HPB50_017434 [Hyalomma asiaticum]|uniref:Uncharacterized protein n=1 Tax=Hyalomma asiaticum TaxID=266040 RepID=A0ACB7SLZ7_HYAAI|nr:hypothetical protein HPB50_017434 [Hyalomma asiaticum]